MKDIILLNKEYRGEYRGDVAFVMKRVLLKMGENICRMKR